jgi:hypothetical protein
MADVYSITTTSTAVAIATPQTLLQLEAPSDKRVRLQFLSVSFDGAASATPAKVHLLRQTTAGTATTDTATPLDMDAPAAGTTCRRLYTVEPTDGDILFSWFATPSGSAFSISFAPGEEPVIPESGRLAVKVESQVGLNAFASMQFAE